MQGTKGALEPGIKRPLSEKQKEILAAPMQYLSKNLEEIEEMTLPPHKHKGGKDANACQIKREVAHALREASTLLYAKCAEMEKSRKGPKPPKHGKGHAPRHMENFYNNLVDGYKDPAWFAANRPPHPPKADEEERMKPEWAAHHVHKFTKHGFKQK